MIKLDISVALFLYLFFTVIGIFILWIWLERGSKFNTFKIGQNNIWQCSVCNYIYIDPKSGNFSRCPRCKSINQFGRSQKKFTEDRLTKIENFHKSGSH